MSIANLFKGLVTLLHSLVESLLLEGDLAGFLKVLLADFLLGRGELCDVGVMALLNILVCAFKDGILLDGLDGLLFLNAAESSVWVILACTEVNSALSFTSVLASSAEFVSAGPGGNLVGRCQCNDSK